MEDTNGQLTLSRTWDKDDVLAAVSSWFDYRTVVPAELKGEIDFFKSQSCATLHWDVGLRQRLYALSRRLRAISKEVNVLANEIYREVEEFGAVERMCGIASLPDEILTSIFDLVVNNSNSTREWKAATILSHVNNHFRTVTLACPQLWTNVSSCQSNDMFAMCYMKSRPLPLSIELTAYEDHVKKKRLFGRASSFLSTVSKSWGRLEVTLNDLYRFHELRYRDVDKSEVNLDEIDAPILEELSVVYTYYSSERRLPLWDWSQWKTPKLRHVKAIFCFPHSLPGLANVTNLELNLPIGYEDMSKLFKEVSQMHQLRELSFSLSNQSKGDPIFVYERLEIPQVQRLEIVTKQDVRVKDTALAYKCSLFSSLFFSGVDRLQLVLKGENYRFYDLEAIRAKGLSPNFYFDQEIARIFRHPDQFPNVQDFRVQTACPSVNLHGPDSETVLSIPFNMLPKVKHFTLESDTRLEVKEPDGLQEIFNKGERGVPRRIIGNAFPALRSVTLDMIDASVVADWLEAYLGQLKMRGWWEGFQELIVVDQRNPYADGSPRKISYPGNKALAWCKDIRDGREDAKDGYASGDIIQSVTNNL